MRILTKTDIDVISDKIKRCEPLKRSDNISYKNITGTVI